MKVKFTKTIDIGDIPAESRKMLDLTKNSILYSLPNVISEVVRYSLSSDGQEFFHSISLIESLREDLRGIDTQLAEVQEIMQGYRDYLVKVAEENVSFLPVCPLVRLLAALATAGYCPRARCSPPRRRHCTSPPRCPPRDDDKVGASPAQGFSRS